MGNFKLEAAGAGLKLMEGSREAFVAMSQVDSDKKALADPGHGPGAPHWLHEGFLSTLTKGRQAPMLLKAFAELVKSKSLSNKSDKDVVAGLFAKVMPDGACGCGE